ncbi:MAG: hypothetical protein IT427_11625 [Pirellulales bacterium]|nr:hypothetical protein [Pirellulales bacterium]
MVRRHAFVASFHESVEISAMGGEALDRNAELKSHSLCRNNRRTARQSTKSFAYYVQRRADFRQPIVDGYLHNV